LLAVVPRASRLILPKFLEKTRKMQSDSRYGSFAITIPADVVVSFINIRPRSPKSLQSLAVMFIHTSMDKKNKAEEPETEDQEQESTETAEEPKTPSLEDEIVALKKSLADANDKYLRLLAEFDNFRKQKLKEQVDFRKYEGRQIFYDFLDVIDNLERALDHKETSNEQLREGIELIYKVFCDVLNRWEITGESAIGSMFDPEKQTAISKVPSASEKPGSIVAELKKAYFYKDKLLRPGEVVVVVEPEQPKTEEDLEGEKVEEEA
jgi:molecular chaperone GrpE